MSETDNTQTSVVDTPTTTTSTTELPPVPANGRLSGITKWFRGGFGFVTNQHTNEDIFVHHSCLTTSVDCWKKLSPGDYVNFTLGTTEDGRPQAEDVTGVHRGPLRCETNALLHAEREKFNTSRGYSNNHSNDDSDEDNNGRRRNRNTRRGRGRGRGGDRGRDRQSRDNGRTTQSSTAQ